MRATDLMDELANTRSTIEDRTAQQIADHWLNALVSVAERASTQPSGAPGHRSEVTAVRFALTNDRYLNAGGRADITFVFATNGTVDYAVLDYSETAPEARAQRVLSGQLAQQLYNWLDQHFRTPDTAPAQPGTAAEHDGKPGDGEAAAQASALVILACEQALDAGEAAHAMIGLLRPDHIVPDRAEIARTMVDSLTDCYQLS